MQRRDFLSTVPLVAGMMVVGNRYTAAATTSKNILEYGAKPDGKTLNSKAIQRAIDAVFQAGGGTVNVPAGVFLTGRIELKSGVTLNLARRKHAARQHIHGRLQLERRHFPAWRAQSAAPDLRDGCRRRDALGQRTNRRTGTERSGNLPDKPPLPEDQQWTEVASHDLAVRKGGRPSPMLSL